MKGQWFTGFRPQTHGFHFHNIFMDTTIKIPPLVITSNMRGGGMAFAALDYYYARFPIPLHTPGDFPNGIPQDGTQLPDYILLRLGTCLAMNGQTLLSWGLMGDQDGFFGEGVPKLTLVEIGRIRQALRSGPVPVCLVNAHSLGEVPLQTHHVVAYGYEDDGRYFSLYLYDTDYPDESSVVVRDKTAETAYSIQQIHQAEPLAWRGFFLDQYFPVLPEYHDIRVTEGVKVEPSTARIGQTFEASYSLVNEGQYPVTSEGFGFEWTGPGGEDYSQWLGHTSHSTLGVGGTLEVKATELPRKTGEHLLRPVAIPSRQLLYARPPAGELRFRVKLPAVVTPQYEFLRQSVEKRPDGLLGLYAVALRGRSENLDPPVSYKWEVGGKYPSTQTGNPVEILLPTGSGPGPYQKECPASVTASASDGSVSADFVISYPKDAHFEVDFSSEFSTAGQGQLVSAYGSGQHIVLVYRRHYTQFLVRLEGLELFRPFGQMVWKPTPVRIPEDNSAVIGRLESLGSHREPELPEPKPERAGMSLPSTPGVLVGVTGTDFIGQRISVSQTVEPYEFVMYVDDVPQEAPETARDWEWDRQYGGRNSRVPVEMDPSMEVVRVAGYALSLPTPDRAKEVVRLPAELVKDLDGAMKLRPSPSAIPILEPLTHR